MAEDFKGGTPLSERDCYVRAIYHVQGLKKCLEGLAVNRMDSRWLMCVRIMDRIEDHIKRLIDKGGPRIVWMPPRED
jgi:hypothetical protein